MQSHCPKPNPKPSRRLSSAMNKLSLNTMRELVKPCAPAADNPVSSQACASEIIAKLPERHSQLPFPILRPNSQTMKNYASQRCDKTFPTSLNFSQQTIYLFDASDYEDDNNLNFYLDDILHGPTASLSHGDDQQEKTPKTRIKQRSLQLTGSSNGNKKTRKFSFNSFPLQKNISFQLPRKGVKKSQSAFFRNTNSSSLVTIAKSVSNEYNETKVNTLEQVFTGVSEHESKTSEDSKFSERKRLTSLPAKLESAYFHHLPELRLKEPRPRPLEDIPEQSQPPTPALSPDCESMNMTSETLKTEVECPRINMILTSSPLFNEGHPALSQVPKPSPSTPSKASVSTLSPRSYGYPYHVLTPTSHPGPETPTTCVNSCCSQYTTTPHGKFLMSTGSPGIFNIPASCTHAQKTPVRRKLSLLSPHPIPSPINGRDFVPNPKNSRGPGPDMLATLEFLSDLCQKSPAYLEEQDSLFDHVSSEGSPES